MKITKAFKAIIVMLMLAISSPAVMAATDKTPTEIAAEKEQVQRLQNRLEEIKAIDKSSLTKDQKKALRGEVKQIKKDMKAISGGIYLSVGAVILIVLLIILLA